MYFYHPAFLFLAVPIHLTLRSLQMPLLIIAPSVYKLWQQGVTSLVFWEPSNVLPDPIFVPKVAIA